MKSAPEWYRYIAAAMQLAPPAATELREVGYIVMPGHLTGRDHEKLSDAYDRAVASARPEDVHVGRSRVSTRIDDFVNAGPLFDGLYVHPPVLAACCHVIAGPFKLSGMRARTLNPGAPVERLHVDVKPGADGWPLVGCILMVDAFDTENGATRFVPGTHLQPRAPDESMPDPHDGHPAQALACGPAGSVIIFNASVWHGHGSNRSGRPRRSVQAHFVPRDARPSPDDPSLRVRPETLRRIDDLAKHVLNVRQV